MRALSSADEVDSGVVGVKVGVGCVTLDLMGSGIILIASVRFCPLSRMRQTEAFRLGRRALFQARRWKPLVRAAKCMFSVASSGRRGRSRQGQRTENGVGYELGSPKNWQ